MAQRMSDIGPFGLRMPASVHRAVKRAAKQNRRSMNSEIVSILERIYAPQAATGEEIGVNAPAAVITHATLPGGASSTTV